MLGFIIVGAMSYGFLMLCKKCGKAIADKKFSKSCPCCGTVVAPDGDSASNLYWKDSICTPAYWYTCPKCRCKFDNSPGYRR